MIKQDPWDWFTENFRFGLTPFPSNDNEDDVPNVSDDTYITHRPFVDPITISKLEQTGVPKKKEVPSGSPSPKQMPPGARMDPNILGAGGQGMGAGGQGIQPGMDPSMFGMEEPGPTSPMEVGRIYELKKIHSRLVSIQSYLENSTETQLITLRNYVFNALDLFRTLISNLDLFKDRLDNIIVMFYKFIEHVYFVLSDYYKNNKAGTKIK